MNLEKVKEFLEQNRESNEVKEFLQGFKTLSVEEIQTLAKTDKELTSWLDSEKDTHHNKAMETFKVKTLPSLIEEEIKKRNPNKDEKDLQLETLQAEFNKMKTAKLRESLRGSAFKFASDNKLPTDLVDYFISLESDDNDEGTKSQESTLANLTKLKDVWSNHLQTEVNERLKSNGITPKGQDSKPIAYTRDQIKGMSTEEIMKLDPQLVNDALKG
ncbi:DUF4355 domain-containing protein [Metabacillus fastidiosus]|uniref:DUF4355 domain-containing protein n=1 Tax=Metabacillus fastidiosus TaxID=1458 RepID=UPI003D2D9891